MPKLTRGFPMTMIITMTMKIITPKLTQSVPANFVPEILPKLMWSAPKKIGTDISPKAQAKTVRRSELYN